MNHIPSLVPEVVVDEAQKQAITQADYAAPEIFSVGRTVDLIQGAQWRGPLDHPSSWPIWPLR